VVKSAVYTTLVRQQAAKETMAMEPFSRYATTAADCRSAAGQFYRARSAARLTKADY
jgi:hypothetical protein